MEAELKHLTTVAPSRLRARESGAWRDVVFSVAEAKRALPYVARIVADAADAFRIVQDSRDALGQIAVIADRKRKRELCELRDRAINRLNLAIDDCNAVGAHLIDLPNGQVSLPALVDDRPVSLVWRIGEDLAEAWAELK